MKVTVSLVFDIGKSSPNSSPAALISLAQRLARELKTTWGIPSVHHVDVEEVTTRRLR